jgi:chitinase
VRAKGKLVILSCGGAGGGIRFSSRDRSAAFVESIQRFNVEAGGTASAPVIDGVDYNTFEADAAPNLPEYIWISQQLRRHFGPDLVISSPPAPWSERDKAFCRQMLAAGAMSYAAPQFYGGRDLEAPDYIVRTTDEWIREVAGGDASKIVVGFGLNPGVRNYSTPTQVEQAWNRIVSAHPTIRGAFLWQDHTDRASNWALPPVSGRGP